MKNPRVAQHELTTIGDNVNRLIHHIRSMLPEGQALSDEVWQHRHRVILTLLWLHVAGVMVFGLSMGNSIVTSIEAALLIASGAVVASHDRFSLHTRAAAASFGFMSASAMLVHLSGGYIEAHFHFFVAIGIITLYQSWTPYLLATGYVIFHHGVIGTLMPHSVYNHHAAHNDAWTWALIHGGFVLAASIVGVVNWRFNEIERKRTEAALRERIAAEEAIQVRDHFLSFAAHELKTPITALQGYAQLFQRRATREGTLNERDQHALTTIVDQAGRLNRMMATLLDVSRIDSGQFSLNCEPLDVSALVQRMVDEVRPTLAQHQLSFQCGDQPLLVFGDELRLEQVIQNLIQNAIKYSPDGGSITVRVERLEDQACITIKDQGIGIPAAALPQLFNRFYRVSNAAERKIGGLGIGLYVVKEILTQHNGTITVESTEGKGSTFSVRLPLHQTYPAANLHQARSEQASNSVCRRSVVVADHISPS